MNADASHQDVQKFLQPLGIEPDAATVYLALNKLGPASALQVSKATGISRTQTYRRLEELQAVGLTSVEALSYGSLYRALPFSNVEGLIAQREAETASAKDQLQAMADAVRLLAGSAAPKATVHHYYGLAGIKQANWNLTKADGSFKVFEKAHISEHLADANGRAFSRRLRERIIEKQLVSYDLTNKTEARSRDLEPLDLSRVHLRTIDPAILRISFEAYIYNDCVTLLDYAADNQLALEIHHPALKAMMEQLFDAMWRIAAPLDIR